jgi:YlmC/YmxH family sporulation protein
MLTRGGFLMVKKTELMLKDVIDINRGKKLGYIDDVDINLDEGTIKALIIPSSQYKMFRFFSKRQDIIIEWKDIHKIGEDVILVSI